MSSWFTSLKAGALDFALECGGKTWFNSSQFGKYGFMTEIRIDTQKRTAHVTLQLRGEKEALDVNLRSYKLTSHDGKTLLELGKVETSREWLNLLIEDFWKPSQRKMEVPGWVKALL